VGFGSTRSLLIVVRRLESCPRLRLRHEASALDAQLRPHGAERVGGVVQIEALASLAASERVLLMLADEAATVANVLRRRLVRWVPRNYAWQSKVVLARRCTRTPTTDFYGLAHVGPQVASARKSPIHASVLAARRPS
jgi:hypothetical protein